MFLAAVQTTKHKRNKHSNNLCFSELHETLFTLPARTRRGAVTATRYNVYIQMPHIAFLVSQEYDTNWKVAQNPRLHLLCTFV